jgi:hypothetical protein
VAISNNRLLDIDNGKVTFYRKDYRDHDRHKIRVIDSPDLPLWVRPGSLTTINALDQLRNEPELE